MRTKEIYERISALDGGSVIFASDFLDMCTERQAGRVLTELDEKGVWNYSFSYGSYQESNSYSFNFGISCPITAPAQYKTYTLNDMTEDYRTKGYDPDSNEIKYDVVTLYRELVWPANDAEKFTINVHTTDGKAYKLIYAADTIPVATDTTEFAPIKADIRQQEYWFQFEGEGVVSGSSSQYRIQIALVGEVVDPTTFYWKQNSIYKPNTSVYNSTTGTYVDIADGWVQVSELKEEEQLVGYKCEAYLLGYDKHCYHSCLTYTINDTALPMVDDAQCTMHATKFLYNGQVIIRNNNKTYNTLGQEL